MIAKEAKAPSQQLTTAVGAGDTRTANPAGATFMLMSRQKWHKLQMQTQYKTLSSLTGITPILVSDQYSRELFLTEFQQ